MEREVFFFKAAQKAIQGFPEGARKTLAFELELLIEGEDPTDFAPMPAVGKGVYEVRVWDDKRTFRAFYVTKYEEAVYVLHAFEKKTQKTPKKEIDIAKKRYRELPVQRKQAKR